MFSDMEEDGDDEVNDEKFEPSSSDFLPKGMMSLVKNLFENHSLFDKPAHGRIMKITIIKKMPTGKLDKKRSNDELSKESSIKTLAKQYASYKLAALRYMDEHNNLDEDTIFNVLVQNR